MTVKLSSLKADVKKENEGDWVPFADWGDGEVAFKVRGITYDGFTTKFDREAMRLAQKYGSESAPKSETEALYGRILAEEILLDWKGLDQPYSYDLAADLLSDPAYRDLRNAVQACAQRITRVKVEFVEASVKN